MSVSRRGFLRALGAGAGLVVTAPARAGGGAKHFPGYAGRFGLLHDATRCVGCRSCEVACRRVNFPESPDAMEDPLDREQVFDALRGTTDEALTVVNRYQPEGSSKPVFRKHQCMHCSEPCCATVCFVGAFEKTPEGPVKYHEDLCVGCRYCVMACPYQALSYEYDEPLTPRVMRCTMCYDRIKDGLNPGCADACPMGAITFGPREELIKVARERIRRHPDKYVDHIFGEHEFGGTSWLTLAGASFGELGLNDDAVHTPLPEIGSSYLGVVPAIITLYPGLLLGFYAFSKRKDKLARESEESAVTGAVAEAVAKGEAAVAKQLEAAAKKAAKAKDSAVKVAVKKALAEAEAARAKGGDE